jgi:hypothetical protein
MHVERLVMAGLRVSRERYSGGKQNRWHQFSGDLHLQLLSWLCSGGASAGFKFWAFQRTKRAKPALKALIPEA